MTLFRILFLSVLTLALSACATTEAPEAPAVADAEPEATRPTTERQFTFSWSFVDGDNMAPRGGMTTGTPVSLDTTPGVAWAALQAPDLTAQERDRRAIVAMAGGYRASFDFIETAGFTSDYEPSRPYRSWGTEKVYVVADTPDFVSLQHILVMFMVGENGETMGPFVIKHWRQDWQFEPETFHEYQGGDSWARTEMDAETARGSWSQTVWQVDDSPRYATIGRWQHDAAMSFWEGEATLRPLPRREYSVRDDYDVLRAVNRHIITPTGWVHEEQNDKLVMGDVPRIIAREAGLNRYERITDHDFTAGDEYWETTAAFWADVRASWQRVHDEHDAFVFKAQADDGILFGKLFEYAGKLEADGDYDASAAQSFIDAAMAAHLSLDGSAEATAGY
ncbi:MAG: DUF6607 family protein [Pseudomonadota bacterium]